jgi:GR25 family glycosyltransferase involved in LPS biosynthesis
MKISAFVITLERATERRTHVDWILRNLPLPGVSISAVDGKVMTPLEVDQCCTRQVHSPRYPHPLGRGEIGCFLSHRKAWQTIIDNQLDAALILEDDVTFDPDRLRDTINWASSQIVQGEYLQLQAREVCFSDNSTDRSEPFALIQPCPVILRTTAQLVTRSAAARLLEASEIFDRPVDAFLQMTWITQVPVKVIVPRVIEEISVQLGGSTLGGRKRSVYERLRREILRPVYRAQIRYLARKAS